MQRILKYAITNSVINHTEEQKNKIKFGEHVPAQVGILRRSMNSEAPVITEQESDQGKSREDLLKELKILRAELNARAFSERLSSTPTGKPSKKKRKDSSDEEAADSVLSYGASLHWAAGLTSVIVNEMYQFVGLTDVDVC